GHLVRVGSGIGLGVRAMIQAARSTSPTEMPMARPHAAADALPMRRPPSLGTRRIPAAARGSSATIRQPEGPGRTSAAPTAGAVGAPLAAQLLRSVAYSTRYGTRTAPRT